MRRLLFAALLVACAYAQASCFLREYEWTRDDDGTWIIDLDAGAPRPLLLELHEIALGAAAANRCVYGATADYVVLAWDRLPFAQLPVSCGGKHAITFGLSTMAADTWGTAPRSPTDGTLFVPQMGRTDMTTAAASAAQQPQRYRRLRLWMVSGAERAPMGALLVEACVAGAAPADLDVAARTVVAPRLLPVASCVHAFGGHCGVDIGWVNMAGEPIELAAHSADNRLSPAYIENGWTLPSVFEPGMHAPDSLRPRMHLGWPCDLGAAAAVEAKWHLDGRTLHLDAMAQRCTLEVVAPGRVLVSSETPHEREQMDSWRAAADGASPVQAFAEQSERPHVAQTAHEVAVEGWRKAGVQFPYMSRISAEAHAAANMAAVNHRAARDDDWDDCASSCCGSDCDAWWISLIVIGAFVLLFFVMLAWCIWWADPEGWYWWPHPHAPHADHPYESPAEYERLHGRAAPKQTEKTV